MKNIGLMILLAFVFVTPTFASYVLPYPSYMPGHKLYRLSRIIDRMKQQWYWGSIASASYHLFLADKYLVEAKTLFEYNQHLLATDALERSDREVSQLISFVEKARSEEKDVRVIARVVWEAMETHRSTLNKLKEDLPATSEWKPEKEPPSVIPIHTLLTQSRDLRNVVHASASNMLVP